MIDNFLKETGISDKELCSALGLTKKELKLWKEGTDQLIEIAGLDLVEPAGFFKDIGQELREIQIRQRLSKKELARMLEVSVEEIEFFEKKKSNEFPHANVIRYLVTNGRKKKVPLIKRKAIETRMFLTSFLFPYLYEEEEDLYEEDDEC